MCFLEIDLFIIECFLTFVKGLTIWWIGLFIRFVIAWLMRWVEIWGRRWLRFWWCLRRWIRGRSRCDRWWEIVRTIVFVLRVLVGVLMMNSFIVWRGRGRWSNMIRQQAILVSNRSWNSWYWSDWQLLSLIYLFLILIYWSWMRLFIWNDFYFLMRWIRRIIFIANYKELMFLCIDFIRRLLIMLLFCIRRRLKLWW